MPTPSQPQPRRWRRALRRARREAAGLRRTTVRGEPRRPAGAALHLRGQRLRLLLPDAGSLVRFAAAGLVTGQVRRLEVILSTTPEHLLTGIRPPRLGRTATGFTWRRQGRRLRVALQWSRPYDVHRAFEDVLRAVLRVRPWDQTSGPVYALDPAAWRDGRSCWPQGRLAAAAPAPERDDAGRPLGPVLAAEPAPGTGSLAAPPIVTAVANPYGRRLVGTATAYRLGWDGEQTVLRDAAGRVVWHAEPGTGPEAALARSDLDKFAVVTVDAPVPPFDRFGGACLRTLAACGMVFAVPDPALRAELDRLGLVTVADAATVADLPGYALSVAAARQTALTSDPALRRTSLAGGGQAGAGGAVPLPGISAVISTMRPEHLDPLLSYLAGQTYPALEVVVGLHGYDLPAATRQELARSLPFPLRVVAFPADQPFGAVLGRLSRLADGELVTKLDDDDHYGANHVTDLFLAWHTSGADLVAKGARFVHFPERDETIDRAWAAPEVFDVTPAGGTMLISRGTLAEIGGWSHSSKHVDADLLARVRSAGGLVYRTHAMEYVYVRRSAGHTFVTEQAELLSHAERTYPGLPPEIVRPGYAPQVPV